MLDFPAQHVWLSEFLFFVGVFPSWNYQCFMVNPPYPTWDDREERVATAGDCGRRDGWTHGRHGGQRDSMEIPPVSTSPKKNDSPQKKGLVRFSNHEPLGFSRDVLWVLFVQIVGGKSPNFHIPNFSTFALLFLFLFLFLLLWLLLLLLMILYGRSRWGLRLNIVGLSFSISWEKGREVIEWVVFGAGLGYLWLLQWKMRDWNGHSTSETSEPSSRAFSNRWAWKL